MAIVCRPVRTPGELEEAYRIRHQVFVLEQGVPLSEEQDADDERAHHVLAWEESRPVGTARLLVRPDLTGKIGRVAVLAEGRGRGIGLALMEWLHGKARELGCLRLALDAQVQVTEFYDRLGYMAEGETFDDCGIQHQRMIRSLA